MSTLRILAVDDHEMTPLGYKYILEDEPIGEYSIQLDIAKDYESGREKLDRSLQSFPYDIILLDIQLAPRNGDGAPPKSGEDLGIYARKVSPNSKIVFMSSYSDNFRINSILQTVDPEGYMVKTEIDQYTLREMIPTVMKNPPYYTHKALAAIRRKMANDDMGLDATDKKILHLLSIGTKTKDMVDHLPLSLPGIENRKRQIKSLFGIEKQNDQALINEARHRGFI
ncbi:MAG: response regulator transcription factor [Eudoraea sp.]|nr:response regulator transcription factor [Eudoraea sp.]